MTSSNRVAVCLDWRCRTNRPSRLSPGASQRIAFVGRSTQVIAAIARAFLQPDLDCLPSDDAPGVSVGQKLKATVVRVVSIELANGRVRTCA